MRTDHFTTLNRSVGISSSATAGYFIDDNEC